MAETTNTTTQQPDALRELLEAGLPLDEARKYLDKGMSAADILSAVRSLQRAGKWHLAGNKPRTENAIDRFQLYTLPELTPSETRPPEFLVDGLIPVGMTFLSGAPKIRKSFLALDLAAAVANGTEFLERRTRQCSVLYADLEGSKSRIATRAAAMRIDLPPNLFICNDLPAKLADGLVDEVRALHFQQPDLRLFIFDTYSRARGNPKATGSNAYDNDVSLLEPIQRAALEDNISVLFVHHDRKGAAAAQDSFERLSGTMGISGSADCVLNLVADGKRADGIARLEYNPRDAIGGEMNLTFDRFTCRWMLSGRQDGELLSDPVINWIVHNAPGKTQARFYDYPGIYAAVFNRSTDRPSDAIRNAVERHQAELFNAYKIAVSPGAKSNSMRGVRVMQL